MLKFVYKIFIEKITLALSTTFYANFQRYGNGSREHQYWQKPAISLVYQCPADVAPNRENAGSLVLAT